MIEDVAIATLENMVAAKGWLNMKTDSLDITIGIVDINGCAVIDQRIYGKSAEPEYSKVKVIKTLLSPVTKLLNNIVNKDCDVFYNGVVQHPKKK
jgi:AsmA protein